MHKLITFLGLKAQDTLYELDGQKQSGRVFAEALYHLVPFDQMLVCATPDAKRDVYPILLALNDPRLVLVPIPTGKTTEEMWRIFDIIVDQVNEGDEVTFDITHGLRSLPFLVFLFAAYLRSAKNIHLRAVYYGALELAKETGVAPVINLTEFVGILDWLTASDEFIQHGDSRRLANLLRSQRDRLAHQAGGGRSFPAGEQLNGVASVLEEISLGLSVIRPEQVMTAVDTYPAKLKMAADTLQELPATHPFILLLERITDTYRDMALKDPREPESIWQSLACERTMIRWYVGHEHYVQSVTLAREWLVSWLMAYLGYDQLTSEVDRKQVEDRLNGDVIQQQSGKKQKKPLKLPAPAPNYESALALWSQIRELRNDIDHAGMRDDPQKASSLHRNIMKLPDALDAFPLKATES
jgi:CRISPR-associated DxTHG motif protein